MNEPIFLSIEQVEVIHRKSLDAHGGLEGLRDRNAFEGAVLQPQNVFFYESGDLFDIAAAYCFYIAQSQAFVDGNKRTAVITGLTFLELNGVASTEFDTQELYDAMISVAERTMDRGGVAAVLRKWLG